MKRFLALVFAGLAINAAAIGAAQAHERGERGWYGAREADEGGGWLVGAVMLGGILAAITAPQPPVYVQPTPVVVPPPAVVVPQPAYAYPAQPTYYVYPTAPVYVQPAYPVQYRYGRRDRDDD